MAWKPFRVSPSIAISPPASELAVTPSAVSQAVRFLEARIGAPLFIRTTRSVGLSEASKRFSARAKPASDELIEASRVARDLGQRPTGLLRITLPIRRWLTAAGDDENSSGWAVHLVNPLKSAV